MDEILPHDIHHKIRMQCKIKKYLVSLSVLSLTCRASGWVISPPVCSSSHTARKAKATVRNTHVYAHIQSHFIHAHAYFLHSSTDALEKLKSMLSADRVPSQLAVTRLVQALGSHGDVGGIQVVESLMKDLGMALNLSSMVFVNNTALAHIKK